MLRLIIFLAFFLSSSSVSAWWGKEHQIVALIAEKNLTKQSKQQIDILLQGKRLSDIANWADSVKFQTKWLQSKRWHYLNIKKDESIDDYKLSVGGDILWALDYFYRQIGEKNRSQDQRREALMFFVHLVADIHQPLHVGIIGNAGGNNQPVIWKGQKRLVNFHKVWDGLLTSPSIHADQYADKINKLSKNKKQWLQSSFKDWAEESLALHKNIYQFDRQENQQKPLSLDANYQDRNWPLAQKRILQAGVRLAHCLNKVFE